MTNEYTFLAETKGGIAQSGHTEKDIIFIGSADGEYSCTGYGASEIPTDLIIVFSDGQQMWRGEYDGSEWWEYSTPFEMPEKETKRITKLKGSLWDSVASINEEKQNV